MASGPGRLEEMLADLFRTLAEVTEEVKVVVGDGGRNAGVMRMRGQVRATTRGTFPLVGVAPRALVPLPNEPAAADDVRAPVEPHHTHLIVVPGKPWGDESPTWPGSPPCWSGARRWSPC